MGTLMNKGDMPFLIIYILLSHTHNRVSSIICGFRMKSHVLVLLLYALQDMSRGVKALEHTLSATTSQQMNKS